MDLYEVLRRRRMVRNYSDESVDPSAVERILDAAIRAPSAGFTQGQRFIVVTEAEKRAAIGEASGESTFRRRGFDPWLSRAPVHVVLCVDEAAYGMRYQATDKVESLGPRDWPVPYWFVDAGASLMLLLLGAVNEGLAAGFAGAHSFAGLRELLGIPEGVVPVGVVTIGHPAPDRPSSSLRRGRLPRDEFVRREHW